ncbi:hypothetical protein NADFUDRAFT_71507 [Nadsonia fulvescens var. elongata DSM 6958]|uniref:Thioredoxin-like protein n=1 Tax=Nadsonia fulvescens var. elongata DSM 6958 TaxID=857566 RepID=A0A1E3PEK7_9ASCO|nr:hypothetical protein NADFUDRAFT_71507 [Nadsonia fulvescens var. elongata DSM 6958]
MFKSLQSIRPVITLFHSPASAASTHIATLLKSLQTAAPQVDVEITELAPTIQQLSSIMDHFPISIPESLPTKPEDAKLNILVPGYLGHWHETARLTAFLKDDAGKKVTRPILVDWDNGRVAVNDESLAQKIISQIEGNHPKSTVD